MVWGLIAGLAGNLLGNVIGDKTTKAAHKAEKYNVDGSAFEDKHSDNRRIRLQRTENRLDLRPEASGIGKQLGLAGKLEDIAMGKAPTVAEQQLAQAQDSNVANILGAANSGVGGPAGLGSLAQSISGSNLQAANQASTAGLQERNAALQGAAGAYGSATGQQIQSQSINDAQKRFLLAQRAAEDQTQTANRIQREKTKAGEVSSRNSVNQSAHDNRENRAADRGNKIVDGLSSGFKALSLF